MRESNKKAISLYILIILFVIGKIFIYNEPANPNYTNMINPLFWIFTAIISFLISKSEISKRMRTKYDIIQSVVIILIIYVMIYFSLGLVLGYERSPYSHQALVIIKNLWAFWLYIVFQEYIRSILVKLSSRKFIYYGAITLLFILSEISFGNIAGNTKNNADTFKYISEVIIPLVVTNCLFTYLAITAGNIPSTLYRSIIILLTLLLPIYPSLNWLLQSMIDIIMVIITALYVNYIEVRSSRELTKRQVKKEKITSYIPFVIVLVAMVSFISGTFKYQPIAVLSDSMKPKFSRGDAVIIEKINTKDLKNLKKGTILYYSREGMMVIHRIVSIEHDKENNYKIITKGDNNKDPDPWIVENADIHGVVKFMIPFIGYPSVLVNDFLK